MVIFIKNKILNYILKYKLYFIKNKYNLLNNYYIGIYNKFYIIDINKLCNNLTKLYLIYYKIITLKQKILFINFYKKYEYIFFQFSFITNSFYLFNIKYINILNNWNIIKKNFKYIKWFLYIYNNINKNNNNNIIIKNLYYKYKKLIKNFSIFFKLFKLPNIILLFSNKIKLNINNKYIIILNNNIKQPINKNNILYIYIHFINKNIIKYILKILFNSYLKYILKICV